MPLASGRVFGVVMLTLLVMSLVGQAQVVRLAQVAAVEAEGRAEVEVDLRVRLERLRLRYQATPYQSERRVAADGKLTVRYQHAPVDGTITLDGSGVRRGWARGTFRLTRLSLDGHAKASVNRDGFAGGELDLLLGPSDVNLGLTATFDRTALDEIDFTARRRADADSTLSGTLHVEDGAWTPHVHLETQLGKVDLASDWRFEADGVAEQTVKVEMPTRTGRSGTLSGRVMATRAGLAPQRLRLRGTVAQLPMDLSLSLSEFQLDALTLQWTARQPPYRLTSELVLGASGLRRARLDLAVHAAETDWRAEVALGPRGRERLELGATSAFGNLSLSSSARFTTTGLQHVELEAVVRRRF